MNYWYYCHIHDDVKEFSTSGLKDRSMMVFCLSLSECQQLILSHAKNGEIDQVNTKWYEHAKCLNVLSTNG